jgi:hypothetical protein
MYNPGQPTRTVDVRAAEDGRAAKKAKATGDVTNQRSHGDDPTLYSRRTGYTCGSALYLRYPVHMDEHTTQHQVVFSEAPGVPTPVIATHRVNTDRLKASSVGSRKPRGISRNVLGGFYTS